MGNAACCCCANDEGAKKDAALDAYIKKWHTDPCRVPKYDKKDYSLAK